MDPTPPNSQGNDHNPPHSHVGTRKLAAVMFTDIKDFSGRMQRDEIGTMRLLQIHNEMMRSAVTEYGGTVIKTVGDAFLVSFTSVIDATQCALTAQQNFHQYNLKFQKPDEKILVRIGVHFGDVIEADKDIFGDGVNIASRIQSMADVGGVNISGEVYQEVKGKLDLRVVDLGVPQLKGINTPVRIYRIVMIPSYKARGKIASNLYVTRTRLGRKQTKRIIGYAIALIVAAAGGLYYFFGTTAPANSVAILPFRNVGAQADEYRADGFTEDLNNYLATAPNLHVISARTASTILKNPGMPETQIARTLSVRYLLTGTFELTKDGMVDIKVRLADLETGTDSWNHPYREPIAQLPHIEDEIMTEVGSRLKSIMNKRIRNVPAAALDDYYQGLASARTENKAGNEIGIAALQSAIEKDSLYTDAHLRLADLEIINNEQAYDLAERWLTDAASHIQVVRRLDSLNPELYSVWGRLYLAKGEHAKGIELLRRCITMAPNYVEAYLRLAGEYLQNQNDRTKAILYYAKAQQIEPSNFIVSLDLGIAYAVGRNFPEAIGAFRRAAMLNPTHEVIWQSLGNVYTFTNAFDSASAAYKNALRLNPANPLTTNNYAELLIREEKIREAERQLQTALSYNPKEFMLLYTLGYVKYREGQPDTAKVVWSFGLKLAEDALQANAGIARYYSDAGLFCARLGKDILAQKYGATAFAKDSSEESAMAFARINAVLGKRGEMIAWFSRARSMNPEYDDSYLGIDFDFEKYKNDQDLLFAARK